MAPTIDGAMYGIKRFSYAKEWSFSPYPEACPSGRAPNQLRVNSDFYVYREASHGFDGLYVVYCESGLLSPGDAYHVSRRYTEGPFQFAFENAIQVHDPQTDRPFSSGVNWVKSSPNTVNQVHDKQDMTVTSVDDSISIGVQAGGSPMGPGGGVNLGYTHSESVQLWRSDNYSIKDWGVVEKTEPVSNTGRWFWHQQVPYDVTELGDPSCGGDFSWWQQAYDGDWPPNPCQEVAQLSTSTLQYNTAIAWRFSLSLLNKGSLPVRFVQSLDWRCALIAQSDWPPTGGHHQIWPECFHASMTHDIDLARVIRDTMIKPQQGGLHSVSNSEDVSKRVTVRSHPSDARQKQAASAVHR